MMRSSLLVSLVVFGLGVGTNRVLSYLWTAKAHVQQAVQDLVPIDFEIKRLAQLTEAMLPEIQAHRKVAAEVDVECEFLSREISELKTKLDESRREMQPLRESLDKPGDKHRFGDRDWTRPEIERDLDRRLVAFQQRQSELTAKERLLATRQSTLDAATAKIHECQKQHVELVQKTEVLRADLKRLELAQAAGTVSFDETQLKAARDLSTEVDKRIRTLAKLVDGDAKPTVIPVVTDKRSVAEKFDALLGTGTKCAAK